MPLETRVVPTAPDRATAPLLAVALARGPLPASLAALDQAAGGALGRLLASGDFAGKRDEVAVLYPGGGPARLVVIGLGKPEDVTVNAIRRAAATAAKRARVIGVAEAAFFVAPEALGTVGAADASRAVAEGLPYGAWHYAELKRPPEEPKPVLASVQVLAPAATAEWERGHAVGAAIGAGQAFTRGLQVLPSNTCTPSYLAERARELGARHGFAVSVLD
jgi:leucyl aminopeptidase